MGYTLHRIGVVRAELTELLQKRKALREEGLFVSDKYNTWCIMQDMRILKRLYAFVRANGMM